MRRRSSRARQAVEQSAGAVGGAHSEHVEETAGDDAPPGMEAVAESGVEPGVKPGVEPGVEPVREIVAAPRADEPDARLSDEATLTYWRNSVLRDPSNVMARRRLARALELGGASLLAVEQLEAAHAVQPDDIELIVELAHAQIALRRFDAAERELKRGLRLSPDSAPVHLALGIISFRRGRYAQAELEMKRVLELDPENGSAYFYRGEALNQLSRLDEALDMLQRATSLQPGNSRAYYVMGILYDKKSRRPEASEMYRKAREAGST